MMKELPPKKPLFSTQRLPRLGSIDSLKSPLQASFSCQCEQQIDIPQGIKVGWVRCLSCSKIHKVGIPPEYIRMACTCGKILTSRKECAGQKGRCPGCHKVWTVPSPLSEDKKTPLKFSCFCGQLHIVKADRAEEKLTCFRCQKEITVPPSIQIMAELAQEKEEKWELSNPYLRLDPFATLQIPLHFSLLEIKEACRQIQFTYTREEQTFQDVQQAKDILVKAPQRMWYEILSPLASSWAHLGNEKILQIHDEAIFSHQKAILWEQKKIFKKADKAWKKSLPLWLKFIQNPLFWEMAQKRQEEIFAGKAKEKTLQKIRFRLLADVVLFIGTQFHQRYFYQRDKIRAEYHQSILEPIVQYICEVDPNNQAAQELFQENIRKKIEELLLKKQWAKAIKKLSQLREDISLEIDLSFLKEMYSHVYELMPGGKMKDELFGKMQEIT